MGLCQKVNGKTTNPIIIQKRSHITIIVLRDLFLEHDFGPIVGVRILKILIQPHHNTYDERADAILIPFVKTVKID